MNSESYSKKICNASKKEFRFGIKSNESCSKKI